MGMTQPTIEHFEAHHSDNLLNNAIEAIYNMGYITNDEAKQLANKRFVRRNKCSTIHVSDIGHKITIFCDEFENFTKQEMLFKLSYDIFTGNVTDELMTDKLTKHIGD